jgi:hypothetical protein
MRPLSDDELLLLMSQPYRPELIGKEDSEESRLQKQAFDVLTDIASNSVLAKFSSGHWFPGCGTHKPLATRWSESDHLNDDIKEGTWAQWLRYASTHDEQARERKTTA